MIDVPVQQTSPYPQLLADLVERLKYRPHWSFWLRRTDRGQGCVGLTLIIQIFAPDTYDTEQMIRVNHYMVVPAASYDERSWRRWLFEQILLVERHEAAEFFQINGVRPYAPHHGPGNDPYVIFEHADIQDTRESYLGVRRAGDDPASETEADRTRDDERAEGQTWGKDKQ